MLLVAIAIASGWPARCAAETDVTVVPAEPQVGDSVSVRADLSYNRTCWAIVSQTCGTESADTLQFTLSVEFCLNHPSGCICADFPVHYVRTCNYGQLAAGTYTVVYTELHNSPADPFSTFTDVLQFTVTEATAVSRHSWGALKLLYR
jgi:hypothetical protein